MKYRHLDYTQFKNLYGDLGITKWTEYNWLAKETNLFNWKIGINNSYLDKNGRVQETVNNFISEYIPVKAGKEYKLMYNVSLEIASSICYYNSNKNFIEGKNYAGSREVYTTAPINATYARLTIPKVSTLFMFRPLDFNFDFQEVEWIGNTGTQYINTQYIGNINNGYYLDFKLQTTTGSQYLFGQRQTSSSEDIFGFTGSTSLNNISASFGYNNSILLTNNRDTSRHKAFNTVFKISYDDNQYDLLNRPNQPTSKIFIFALNSNNIKAEPVRIYNAKIYNGTDIVYNFIPCYRKYDNEVGLWDLVNNKFYTNDGTGTFTKGGDI